MTLRKSSEYVVVTELQKSSQCFKIFNAAFADVQEYSSSELVIKSPYAIQNRPGTKNAVMYISDIKNKSSDDIKLKGITTSVAEFSEIHSMENHDGVMKMRKISHILIPKNKTHKIIE